MAHSDPCEGRGCTDTNLLCQVGCCKCSEHSQVHARCDTLPWLLNKSSTNYISALESQAALAFAGDPHGLKHLSQCRALNAAASVHRLSGFETAAPGDGTSPGILAHLASLTEACIGAGGLEQGDEGGWAADAVDILLDAWVELLQITAARGYALHQP